MLSKTARVNRVVEAINKGMWRIGFNVLLTLGLALVALTALTSCGGAGLSADSSCKDFLNASVEDQDQAVSSIAGDLEAANAVTPLGRPNVNYLCANDPDKTLGEAIEATG